MAGSLLDGLGADERAVITARLRRREYRRGQAVFNDGDAADCLYIVERGRLDVQVTTPAGAIVTLRVVHPGEIVGELALVHPGNRRTGRVRALETSVLLALHRDDFEELRARHPGVDRFLVSALAERVVETSRITVELMMPPEDRLWRRLAVLAEAYGDEPIRMSQDDLAAAAGTVRQTANRVLQAGARDGVLAVERGVVRVLDPAALFARAGRR